MASSTVNSWYDYSKWISNIARNMRITEPTGAELTAVGTFLDVIYNPLTRTGTRSWLQTLFDKKSVRNTAGARGAHSIEPTHVEIEILARIGRDLKMIPLQTTEDAAAVALIAATSNRRYGAGATFGGVGGALVAV